jgi:divalent metal cation (Fe/Co/Zn/Cd) transporter
VGFAAVAARSVALAGFAIDSFIEIFASIVVVWQMKGVGEPRQERRAIRLIGLAFFFLAAFIACQAVVTIVAGVRPDKSLLGIGWLSLTVLAMLGLGLWKSRAGSNLGNAALQKEARVTMVDGALAAGILAGLLLNAALGWWWADVAAGAILVVYGLIEGREALHE